MSYRVEIAPAANREMRRLPQNVQERLRPAILSLGDDPRPHGVRKLKGATHAYRIRVGEYRVVYEVYDDTSSVILLHVARRNESTYSDLERHPVRTGSATAARGLRAGASRRARRSC